MTTVITLVEGEMTAKKAVRRDDVAVKVDRALIDKARLVAARRRITLAEYLSELIQAPVERDFARVVREMERAEGAPDVPREATPTPKGKKRAK